MNETKSTLKAINADGGAIASDKETIKATTAPRATNADAETTVTNVIKTLEGKITANTPDEENKREVSSSPVNGDEEEDLFESTFGTGARRSKGTKELTPATNITEVQSEGLSKRKFVPRRLKIGTLQPYSVIAESHSTVVRSPDGTGWIELRCDLCGANHNGLKPGKGKSFFFGVRGFGTHFMNCHYSVLLEQGERLERKTIVSRCVHHHLSDEEAQGILNGDANAYLAPKIQGAGREAKYSKKAKLERDDNALNGGTVPQDLDAEGNGPIKAARASTLKGISEYFSKAGDSNRKTARRSSPMLGNKRTSDLMEEDEMA